MSTAEQLYKEYITALLFLRKLHTRYGEPVSLEYFRAQVNRTILIRMANEGLCHVYEDYYWDEQLLKHVPAIGISFRGLWKAFLQVPPK